MVKCGFCGQLFNALERLHDKPVAPAKTAVPPSMDQDIPAEPQFYIPDQGDNDQGSNAGLATTSPVHETSAQHRVRQDRPATGSIRADTERPAGIAKQEIQKPGKDTKAANSTVSTKESRAKVVSTPGNQAASRASGLSASRRTAADTRTKENTAGTIKRQGLKYQPAEEILETRTDRPGLLNRLVWGGGIIILIILTASQVIWFNRDYIMGRYPQSIPWFQSICQKIECEIIRHRDLTAIRLINRDVRDHPRYKDALLVNATMSNQSHTVQPFPVVQLNLFDTEGNLIAYRQFQPQDYLDESINIMQGMKPDVPVHFVLEVLGSVEGAVSFEFEFQ